MNDKVQWLVTGARLVNFGRRDAAATDRDCGQYPRYIAGSRQAEGMHSPNISL